MKTPGARTQNQVRRALAPRSGEADGGRAGAPEAGGGSQAVCPLSR